VFSESVQHPSQISRLALHANTALDHADLLHLAKRLHQYTVQRLAASADVVCRPFQSTILALAAKQVPR
jgi:hypothetical protein